jgi:hypothetical protein
MHQKLDVICTKITDIFKEEKATYLDRLSNTKQGSLDLPIEKYYSNFGKISECMDKIADLDEGDIQ